MVSQGREKIILEKDSMYHHIVVSEEDGVRYLKFGNNIVQSAVFIDDPVALKVDYTMYLPLGLIFKPEGSNMLLIGLGGGSIPRLFRQYCPGIRITAVEIDPEVVEIAKRYFFVPERPDYDIKVVDGRVFVKRTKEKYDIIMLDAYNSDSIPFHLTTVEFLLEVKSRLNPGGVVVANLWSSDYRLYLALLKTYQRVFKYIHRFKVLGKFNMIIVAGDKTLSRYEIIQRATILQEKIGFPYDFVDRASHLDLETPDTANAPLLTDDYAPVDWLQNLEK